MTVEERLARLERELRVHRVSWGIAVVAGFAAFLLGATGSQVPDVIRAHRLELLDEKGGVQIEADAGTAVSSIVFKPNSGGAISLVNGMGFPSIGIMTERLVSRLEPVGVSVGTRQKVEIGEDERSLQYISEIVLAEMGVVSKDNAFGGSMRLKQWERTEQPLTQSESETAILRPSQIGLTVTPDGKPLALLSSKEGELYVAFGADDSGVGTIEVHRNGKLQVQLTSAENGGAVSILNKTGEHVVTMNPDEYGNGRIGAWNRKGRGRTLQPGPSD